MTPLVKEADTVRIQLLNPHTFLTFLFWQKNVEITRCSGHPSIPELITNSPWCSNTLPHALPDLARLWRQINDTRSSGKAECMFWDFFFSPSGEARWKYDYHGGQLMCHFLIVRMVSRKLTKLSLWSRIVEGQSLGFDEFTKVLLGLLETSLPWWHLPAFPFTVISLL